MGDGVSLCLARPPTPNLGFFFFFLRRGDKVAQRSVCVGLCISQSLHSICAHSSPPACACRRHHQVSKHLLGKARHHQVNLNNPQKTSSRPQTHARLSEPNTFFFKTPAVEKLTLAAPYLLLADCLTAATLSHDTLPLLTAAVGLPEGGEGRGKAALPTPQARRGGETGQKEKAIEPPRSSPAGNAEQLRLEVLAAVHAVCSVF